MITKKEYCILQEKVAELNLKYHLDDSNEKIILTQFNKMSVCIDDMTEKNVYTKFNEAVVRLMNIEYCLMDLT